jgi:hypothetical protein
MEIYKAFEPDLSIDPRAKEDYEAGHKLFLPYPKWVESQLNLYHTVEDKTEFLSMLIAKCKTNLFTGRSALCNCYLKSGYNAQFRAAYWDYSETLHWLNWKIGEQRTGNKPDTMKQGREVSNAQLVLVYWFGIKALGVSMGHMQDKTRFAWLLHLLTGKECNDIDNSNFYKMLKKAPIIHKSAKANLRELEKARAAFEKIASLSDVLGEIDTVIRKVRNGELDND